MVGFECLVYQFLNLLQVLRSRSPVKIQDERLRFVQPAGFHQNGPESLGLGQEFMIMRRRVLDRRLKELEGGRLLS